MIWSKRLFIIEYYVGKSRIEYLNFFFHFISFLSVFLSLLNCGIMHCGFHFITLCMCSSLPERKEHKQTQNLFGRSFYVFHGIHGILQQPQLFKTNTRAMNYARILKIIPVTSLTVVLSQHQHKHFVRDFLNFCISLVEDFFCPPTGHTLSVIHFEWICVQK